MGRNIVFLDFDGVMLADYNRSHAIPSSEFVGLKKKMAELHGNDAYLDIGNDDIAAVLYDWLPETVSNLRRIVESCDAGIVVSSSWRLYDDDESLEALLELHGLGYAFVGATRRSYENIREPLILEWLDSHRSEVSNWVAIDDANLKGLGGHFVKTGTRLTARQADKAIGILSDVGKASCMEMDLDLKLAGDIRCA